MQHNYSNEMMTIASQRSNTFAELVTVCGTFMKHLEEERKKILSLILPVSILVSASKKTNPNQDVYEILKKYRYHKNPNAENIILLSELFDVHGYIKSVQEMFKDGLIAAEEATVYEEAMEGKMLEKESIMNKITFASIDEIEEAFNSVSAFDEEE